MVMHTQIKLFSYDPKSKFESLHFGDANQNACGLRTITTQQDDLDDASPGSKFTGQPTSASLLGPCRTLRLVVRQSPQTRGSSLFS